MRLFKKDMVLAPPMDLQGKYIASKVIMVNDFLKSCEGFEFVCKLVTHALRNVNHTSTLTA
jgi:hypothetical protein